MTPYVSPLASPTERLSLVGAGGLYAGVVVRLLEPQVFNLTRKPAMAELLQTSPDDPRVTTFCSGATSLLLIGWASGGIFFGVLGDRIGRVKTLT